LTFSASCICSVVTHQSRFQWQYLKLEYMLFGVWLEPLFKVYPFSWLLTGFAMWFLCTVLFAGIESLFSVVNSSTSIALSHFCCFVLCICRLDLEVCYLQVMYHR